MKIALDAMGGDLAPQATVQGALDALNHTQDNLHIILVGDKSLIQSELGNSIPNGLTIHPTTEVVTMHDDGSTVLRAKPDSSIVQGIRLIKDKKADAFISAGHTGAVMATSLFLLGRIPHVKRPCLGGKRKRVEKSFVMWAPIPMPNQNIYFNLQLWLQSIWIMWKVSRIIKWL
jgi:glycerol-3-phosphate acyltransferase PlsX